MISVALYRATFNIFSDIYRKLDVIVESTMLRDESAQVVFLLKYNTVGNRDIDAVKTKICTYALILSTLRSSVGTYF